MNISSIFKHYNQWRRRHIIINETAWQVYGDMRARLFPPTVAEAALQLRKKLREQGIEISDIDACKRMVKLEKGH